MLINGCKITCVYAQSRHIPETPVLDFPQLLTANLYTVGACVNVVRRPCSDTHCITAPYKFRVIIIIIILSPPVAKIMRAKNKKLKSKVGMVKGLQKQSFQVSKLNWNIIWWPRVSERGIIVTIIVSGMVQWLSHWFLLANFPWSIPDIWMTCDFVGEVDTMGQPVRPTQLSIPSGR